eukprot:8035264-Pyramimonas_sp.AAC.1
MAPEATNLGLEVVGMVSKLLAKHLPWIAASQTDRTEAERDGEQVPTPADTDLGDGDFDEI